MSITSKASLSRFSIILFVFIISSCSLTYVPDNVHVPLHNKAGELYCLASAGSSGLGLSSSYSASNNLFIMGSSSYFSEEFFTHYSFNGGIGYYENYENYTVFEASVGGGYGYTERLPGDTYVTQLMEHTNGYYYSAFFQPALGLNQSNFEASIALRLTYVDYNSLITPPVHNFSRVFFEPTLTIKYFWMSFGLVLQSGSSIPLGSLPTEIDYYPAFLSLGLQYNFDFR